MTFSTAQLDALKSAWNHTPAASRRLFMPIQDEQHYQDALQAFESLLSEVEGEIAPSTATLELFHTIATHLRIYEQKESLPPASGPELLSFLMQRHNLKQSDLTEIGSQGVVSEILSGKRNLNIRQAKALGLRFKLNYTAFLE